MQRGHGGVRAGFRRGDFGMAEIKEALRKVAALGEIFAQGLQGFRNERVLDFDARFRPQQDDALLRGNLRVGLAHAKTFLG